MLRVELCTIHLLPHILMPYYIDLPLNGPLKLVILFQCICTMLMTTLLHVHHGGYFQTVSHLVYGLGEIKQVERDTNYLSVGNTKQLLSS